MNTSYLSKILNDVAGYVLLLILVSPFIIWWVMQ